jgi:hypothetical protein
MQKNKQLLEKLISAACVVALLSGFTTIIQTSKQKVVPTAIEVIASDKKEVLRKDKRSSRVRVIDDLRGYRDQLTDKQLIDLLDAVGFRGDGLRTAWAVAKRESNGRPRAHNQNSATGDNSYGMFQINMIGDLEKARLEKLKLDSSRQLFDPVTNVMAVFYMTKGGTDWSAWDIGSRAYNNGKNEPKYLEWLAKYPEKY